MSKPIPAPKSGVSADSKTVPVKGKLRDVALDSDCHEFKTLPCGWYWINNMDNETSKVDTVQGEMSHLDWCRSEAKRIAKALNTSTGLVRVMVDRWARCQTCVKGEYKIGPQGGV